MKDTRRIAWGIALIVAFIVIVELIFKLDKNIPVENTFSSYLIRLF
jgi:hypothetical protein